MNEHENEISQDDEISLIDLFAVLWHRKVMIIIITLIAMVGVIVFSILSLVLPSDISPLPNVYTPTALMLINNASSSSGAMASMIGASGLGGLAGLAGVSTGSTFSDLAIYMVGTNSFLDAVVDTFDMINRYEIEEFPRANSRKMLKKKLSAAYDEKSGVFNISFTDLDSAFGQEVVNFCVRYLGKRFDELGIDKNKLEEENLKKNRDNTLEEIQKREQEIQELEYSIQRSYNSIPAMSLKLSQINLQLAAQRQVYTQLTVQYEMLKITMASEKPVFQILELAEVPEQKSGPSRGMLCVIVTFAAGFFSVFLAFVLNAIANIRKDPEAMAKLQKPKKQV